MNSFSITNVTAVLPDSVLENVTIVVERGVITEIATGISALRGSIDAHGLYCLPGVIDTHSDGLEQEHRPRPNVNLPLDFSLRSFEAKVRSAGISTMFHGIAFENDGNRTVELANSLVDALHDYADSRNSLVDNRVLYRLDARDNDGFNALVTRIESDMDRARDYAPLVSFEDHTPGTGQYRDRTYFENWVMRNRNLSQEEARAHVDNVIAERDAVIHNRDLALPWLTERAQAGIIRLMVHDPATPEDVEEGASWNASIAEFPTTIEAARAAHAKGMRIVSGAPNVLRGGSHSGNVSAAELISLGLCDGLSSDYLPFSMLGAVAVLVRDKVCSLPRAVGLITSGPAKTVGLLDRGELKVGTAADLALCRFNGIIPTVVGVFRAGSHAGQTLTLQGA